MGLFGPPNIEKMKAKGDLKGLEKALGYQKDRLIRRSAAEALGDLKSVQSVEPLITALKDSDSTVGTQAAVALGKIGNVRAIEPLITALIDSYLYT